VQIEDWCDDPFKRSNKVSAISSSEKDAKPVLQLEVPPGQLDIGRRLVQVIYSSSPDLSDLTPKQLLKLAGVADKYMVGKALAAAGAALQQVEWGSLSCEEAAAVFEVPDTGNTLTAHQKVVSEARAAALDRLVTLLGDLEEAWGKADDGSCSGQLLLQLPAEALLYLLTNQHFRASSEDSVYHTVTQWLKAHPGTPVDLQCRLAKALRLTSCTSSYFTAVVCSPSSWLMPLKVLSPEDIARTSALCAMPEEQRKLWVNQAAAGGAWRLQVAGPAREPSNVTDLVLEWDIPLDLFQQMPPLDDWGSRYAMTPPGAPNPVFWQGREFKLSVVVNRVCERFDVSLTCQGAPAMCSVQCNMFAVPTSRPGERMRLEVAPQSGVLGAPQLLALTAGHATSVVSCSVRPHAYTYPNQWWSPLEGRFLAATNQYTSATVSVQITAVQ
jgi:hypothetical protein